MERSGGIALWRQIAQALEADIASGVYAPGAKLPTEAQLAERFRVNRHTLRRAISHLQLAGQVRVEQGRGTFVQAGSVPLHVGGKAHGGYDEEAARSRVLRTGLFRADPQSARSLGLKVGDPVVVIEFLHLNDGRPVTITSHHFPGARFDGLIEAYREEGRLSAALRRFGVEDCLCKRTKVSARLPSAADARHLHMPRNQPVVVAESVNVDAAGRPVDYSVTRSAGQRTQ
ncbi:MAG: phosphonate metabolism transcriptional regulator PhnF, partial [Alphaproteobacteria bacterium]